MRIPKPFAAAVLALLAGPALRADTIDVTSTTMLRLGEQTRGGQPLQEPSLVTVAPVFEIMSITARDVTNPVFDDLSVVISTWGSADLADDRRWDNGTTSALTGDVMTGYVQGKLLDRRLTLRLGREHVTTGVARMLHLDGAEAIAQLPLGVRLSGYAGVPVSQRFASRGTLVSWNPTGGDFAFGGRAAWALPFAGFPGRGLELGASANFVRDDGDPVREELAGDFRLQPYNGDLTFSGLAAYSLWDERVSEVAGRAFWSATRRLLVEAEARYYAPDLFLARNSILAVFSSEDRAVFGGGASYDLARGLTLGANYRLALEPDEDDGDYIGHEADARLEWVRGATRAGGEVLFLDAFENGYVALRVFGRQDFGRFFAAADVLGHLFRDPVNGEDGAITGALTAGVNLARGFSAVVSGRAGMTPYLEQTFDVMAKLAYNASYRIQEVR
jgi:hypothetical protein